MSWFRSWVIDYLPFWFASLMVVGVAAASMSTADSQLLVSSALTFKDLYKLHLKKDATDAQMLTVGRLFVLIAWARPVMFIRFVTDLSWPGTVQIMPATVGGLYWRRGSTPGALWGTGAGLAVVALLTYPFPAKPLGFTPVMWPADQYFALHLHQSKDPSIRGGHQKVFQGLRMNVPSPISSNTLNYRDKFLVDKSTCFCYYAYEFPPANVFFYPIGG